MAETYKAMDKQAADGMRTADDKVAAVVDGWVRARADKDASTPRLRDLDPREGSKASRRRRGAA